jgi:hypothetical protein
LGTTVGLLLGGYGGRKHAEKKDRTRSEREYGHREGFRDRDVGGERDRDWGRRDGFRDRDAGGKGYGDERRERRRDRERKHESGWDEGSATFKMGTSVR